MDEDFSTYTRTPHIPDARSPLFGVKEVGVVEERLEFAADRTGMRYEDLVRLSSSQSSSQVC
jgi:hypothetical protein